MTASHAPRLALAAALAASACTAADPLGPESSSEAVARFGRVDVSWVAAPAAGGPREGAPEGSLAAQARFVEIHADGDGDERLARWLGLDAPQAATPAPGTCLRAGDLAGDDPALDEVEAFDGEVVFLDAGDVEVRVQGAAFEVPVHLVPDLLPFVSGVAYALADRPVPDPGDVLRLEVAADGSAADGVPPFRAAVALEPVRDPVVRPASDGVLWLAWTPPAQPGGTVLVEIGEAGDDEVAVVCGFEDDGDAGVDLHALGWEPRAVEDVAVSIARTTRVTVDADGEIPTDLVFAVKSRAVLLAGEP